MPQAFQIICNGIGVLVLATIMVQLLAMFLHHRSQKNDPLRYLRGKSREEIRQILLTPTLIPHRKNVPVPKTKPIKRVKSGSWQSLKTAPGKHQTALRESSNQVVK